MLILGYVLVAISVGLWCLGIAWPICLVVYFLGLAAVMPIIVKGLKEYIALVRSYHEL